MASDLLATPPDPVAQPRTRTRTRAHTVHADLTGFRIAALVDDHFEQIELTAPQAAFEATGAKVDLVAPHAQLTGLKHLEEAWRGHGQSGPTLPQVEARPPSDQRERPKQKVAVPLTPADTFSPDVLLSEAEADQYDALFLPGGVINADHLRMNARARQFAREMVRQAKPVAVICHGGWLLISAGLVQGRTVTSWPSLQDDYRNAGARWVDEPVVSDGNWVSSRKPDDIPVFSRAAIEVFSTSQRHQRAA